MKKLQALVLGFTAAVLMLAPVALCFSTFAANNYVTLADGSGGPPPPPILPPPLA
jgi:hypothetical protein